MRYLVTTSYRGTNFCGWQKQTVSKLPSVEEEIERVFSKILNTDVKIYGSGRTDAGVHALGQTFHFDTSKEIDEFRFLHGVNELLSKDIRILNMKAVNNDFHARFNVTKKTYIYKVNNSKNSDPFKNDLEYHLAQKLDIEKMVESSQIFVGEHNFQNFTSKEEDDANFVRNIYEITVKSENSNIEITLTGNGFMRYMVRMIVGTLIQVGLGKITKEEVLKNLNEKQRKPSSYKAPSCGLYLKEVFYN